MTTTKLSPTQRSLTYLREQGWVADVVERWKGPRNRSDFLGVIDIVGVRPGQTVGVQTTTTGNSAARVHKLEASEHFDDLRGAGWLLCVHGWSRHVDGLWHLKETWL